MPKSMFRSTKIKKCKSVTFKLDTPEIFTTEYVDEMIERKSK